MVAEVIHLSGVNFSGNPSVPTILSRTDRQFIPNVLNCLRTEEGRREIAQTVMPQTVPGDGHKLYQPVHQVFHVVLVQAFCQTFGSPRLDPARIDSCGVVVRRISSDRHRPGVMERWSKKDGKIVGWVPCPNDDLDPDPSRRQRKTTTGNAEIDRRLPSPFSPYDGMTESVAPLFIAPPAACAAANATILYGLIPVTSTEKSEITSVPTFEPGFITPHLPYFLQPNGSLTVPRAGEELTWLHSIDPSLAPDSDTTKQLKYNGLIPFLSILRQLKFEFDVFDDTPEGRAILDALNQFAVSQEPHGPPIGWGDFLNKAATVLIGPPPNNGDTSGTGRQNGENKAPTPTSVWMPLKWPDINNGERARIASLIQKSMQARLHSIVSGDGRYEGADRQYRMRAFIRVKQPDGCPPQLIRSNESLQFAIAPWHESSPLPPIKIQLPKLLRDPKKFKPNVAFTMDNDLFSKLQRDPKKTLKGETSSGGDNRLGWEWICAFNIPIITICAFLVLNIFLSLFALFDFFFALALSLKICVPIPVSNKGSQGAGG